MRRHSIHGGQSLAFFAGLICFAGSASAQSLMSTSGVVVATNGDSVPDAVGTPIAGYTFGGSSALGDTPVIDENGKIFFRARMVDAGGQLTTFNDRALFYGSSRANLKMVVQGGDQAPGLAAGILLRTTTGSSSALGGSVRVGPSGKLWWGSNMYDGGVSVTSSNDSAVFGGDFGAQTLLVRKGDVATGTGGATFAQAFESPSQQFTGINRSGRIYFQGALVNGTGVPAVTTLAGMNNQSGIWSGMPGALELVVRKSDPVSGLGGAVAIDTFTSIGSVTQMNDAGHLLYEVVLSTTQGSPAANTMNDRAYMMHTPGAGSVVIVREGDVAPGTFNPSSGTNATFNAQIGDQWSAGVSGNCWTRNDEMIFQSELTGGDVLPGTNDRALFRGGPIALSLVQRRGDPAPGTNATFAAWNNNSLSLNGNGAICFQGILEGGTSTANDDSGVWAGMQGALALVLREGAVVPGTGGSTAGNLSGSPIYFNDQGQVLFNVNLVGGTVVGTALFAWDAAHGLIPVLLPGDSIEVSTGVFKTTTTFSGVQFNNTNGAALHFGHDGRIALRVGLSDNTNALMIAELPAASPATPFCFGDGSATACPCGAGAAGNGCPNSVNASGANLSASGVASIGSDTFVLHGTGMPNSSALYFQGTSRQGAGMGSIFGDGLRCAGGTIIRLGTQLNAGGASQYPETGDPTVSVRGSIGTPGTRTYQVWYRNANAAFCGPSTFNLSNGLERSWAP